jgi:predicted ABC-type ATPase
MARLTVLAGTNGAGKSSIAGAMLREAGGQYFNPDEETRRILIANPGMDEATANALAWRANIEHLQAAIDTGIDYTFETTLGGRTVTGLLLEAAAADLEICVWYCGLDSPELHLERIRSRVAHGGHDIPPDRVRERYTSSQHNLIRLLPHLHHLVVYDNSIDANPVAGHRPAPLKLLEWHAGTLRYPGTPAELRQTPAWAQALVAYAFDLAQGVGG